MGFFIPLGRSLPPGFLRRLLLRSLRRGAGFLIPGRAVRNLFCRGRNGTPSALPPGRGSTPADPGRPNACFVPSRLAAQLCARLRKSAHPTPCAAHGVGSPGEGVKSSGSAPSLDRTPTASEAMPPLALEAPNRSPGCRSCRHTSPSAKHGSAGGAQGPASHSPYPTSEAASGHRQSDAAGRTEGIQGGKVHRRPWASPLRPAPEGVNTCHAAKLRPAPPPESPSPLGARDSKGTARTVPLARGGTGGAGSVLL